MDLVCRHGHLRSLITERLETAQVHHDLASVIVDVHVRRGDVGGDEVIAQRGPQLVIERRSLAAGDLLDRLGIDHEILDEEAGVGQLQRAGLVDGSRSLGCVGVGEPDEGALVVGEVAKVWAERIRQPRRRTDDRWALNVGADAGMTGRHDDRTVADALDTKTAVSHAPSSRRMILPPSPRGISSTRSTLVGHL